MTCHSNGRRPRIEVHTTRNGYTLDADGLQNGCFYFSPEELLQGFMAHVGMHLTTELDRDKMAGFIEATIAWRDNVKGMQEIQRLTIQAKNERAKNNGLKRRVADERRKLVKLVKGVRTALESFGATGRLRRHLSDIIFPYGTLKNFKCDGNGVPVLGNWNDSDSETENEETA